MDFKNLLPMIKSTFKDISFFGVFNWNTFHSQTQKYVEIISTPDFTDQNEPKGEPHENEFWVFSNSEMNVTNS